MLLPREVADGNPYGEFGNVKSIVSKIAAGLSLTVFLV